MVVVILTLIIGFLFYPLKNKIQIVIDKIFYKEKIDYQKKIGEFTEIMNSTLEQRRISHSILELVETSLGVENSVLMFSDDKNENFVVSEAKGLSSELLNKVRIRKDVDFLDWIKKYCCKPIDIGQLSIDHQFRNFFIQNKEELQKIKTAVLIPLIISDKSVALFSMGNRKTGEIFTYRNLDFLTALAKQFSVGIRNARLYEELKEVHRQLSHADKLAALGKLSAGIAHEIRNPLGIIKSSAQILENRLKEKESEYKLVEFISTEVDRLSNIVNEFLEFAQSKEPNLKRSNIDGIMDRILQLTNQMATKQKVEVKKRFDKRLPEVMVDIDQMYQVFLNMVMNSLQSMPDGGELQVNIGTLNHEFVQIEIRDTGKGIPEEIINKIFEPFFTTRAEGIGLGLTIVNKIITDHKGIILVDSKEGLGTTFNIRLPILKD
ncbi:MAG: ATP-binding protein [bacterium]